VGVITVRRCKSFFRRVRRSGPSTSTAMAWPARVRGRLCRRQRETGRRRARRAPPAASRRIAPLFVPRSARVCVQRARVGLRGATGM
jgi:hypothetical protein